MNNYNYDSSDTATQTTKWDILRPPADFSVNPDAAQQYMIDQAAKGPIAADYTRSGERINYRDISISIWNDPNRIVHYRDNYIHNPYYLTNRTAYQYQRYLYSHTEKMLAEVPHGGKLLDIGCGRGVAAVKNAIDRPDANTVGLDHNFISGTVPYNPNTVGGYQPVQGDWLELAEIFPEEEFDLVFCMCSALLHFKTEQQLRQIIDGITHVMKCGGILRATGDAFWSRNPNLNGGVVATLEEKNWHVRPTNFTLSPGHR